MAHWRRPPIPQRHVIGPQGRRAITLVAVAVAGLWLLYEALWQRHLFEAIAWIGALITKAVAP